MPRVLLTKIKIRNFGPICDDAVTFEPFTYFIGRNNAGKSHYLKAIEVLLASKAPQKSEIVKLQHDKTREIRIEGEFIGVEHFTSLVSSSNHKEAIENSINNGVLRVIRVLDPNEDAEFGIYKSDDTIYNPSGFAGNLLKILPDTISIPATADTEDELKNTQTTALGRLKRETLVVFFEELKAKTKEALSGLDAFLHSQDGDTRSPELIKLEERLKEELMGEFAGVIPSIEFALPDEEVIAKEMKILIDDGHRSEVEQKGHGLQRATLLALLKVLAKYGARYQDRPSPLFLIGELESFLHPYAQKQFGAILAALVDRYQVITTTHSPFIIAPDAIGGYRRVRKSATGTVAVMAQQNDLDLNLIKRHLERRGNLEGLFADRIILVEGDNDEGFYHKVASILNIDVLPNLFTLTVKSGNGGKTETRMARKFYKQMGFNDVAIIADLDYLFSVDVVNLLKELGIDGNHILKFRKHIDWSKEGDPPLEFVREQLQQKGLPTDFDAVLTELRKHRVFILREGSPEAYYKNNNGGKRAWVNLRSGADLIEEKVGYLKEFVQDVLQG